MGCWRKFYWRLGVDTIKIQRSISMLINMALLESSSSKSWPFTYWFFIHLIPRSQLILLPFRFPAWVQFGALCSRDRCQTCLSPTPVNWDRSISEQSTAQPCEPLGTGHWASECVSTCWSSSLLSEDLTQTAWSQTSSTGLSQLAIQSRGGERVSLPSGFTQVLLSPKISKQSIHVITCI